MNFVSTEAANRIEYLQTGKVDVILANFTVTPERAEEVDFAAPYMNVALGVVSKDDNVITTLDNWNADDSIIVISGTTAETYLIANYPDIPLQKFDSYATAKEAFENGTSVAWANDNTEVIAFALQNEGYTVGIPSLAALIPSLPQYLRAILLCLTGSTMRSQALVKRTSSMQITRQLWQIPMVWITRTAW